SSFPLAMGYIIREYWITETHLTLDSEKSDYQRWGRPAEASVGAGWELWARM
ncbi:hypothetical protein DFH07DRAFT_722204, partial [Mycena maculata]